MMSFDSTTTYIVAAAVVVAVFALSLVATLRVRGGRRGRSDDPYVRGLKLLLQGDRDAAYTSLQKSLRSGKAPTDAYIRLGAMLRENGDPGKALQMHRSLTVKTDLTKQEKVELFVNIAKDYSALGNAAQAATVLETAVKSMGLRDPDVLRLLAKEYHVIGKTDDAYRLLKEMKRSGGVGERELSLYLCTAGERRTEDGDLREARKFFQRALKHKPDNSTALRALGDLEEKLGNEDEALRHWRKAAMASPELSAEALKNIERVMFQRGTFGEIEQVYRDVLESRPRAEYATLALASFYKKQGRGEEAIGILEEFRNKRPDSIESTVLLTSLYAGHKDIATLEKFLEENEARTADRTAQYVCSECHHQTPGMRWHCPRCNSFDSFAEKHED
jgi:lipopolysaccharide biosynthesis regulator YciM